MTDKELKELYEWKGEITAEQRALKRLMETKFDTVHDKLDTVNDNLMQHVEDDRKNFVEVGKNLVETREKIIKIIAVGAVVLTILSWVGLALINKFV